MENNLVLQMTNDDGNSLANVIDPCSIQARCIARMESLYRDGLSIYMESEKPKDRVEALKLLRSIAKDERDFLGDIGLIEKVSKKKVETTIEIDGVPVSQMPMQDLEEKAPLEIKRILGRWIKDKEAQEMMKDISLTFGEVRYED